MDSISKIQVNNTTYALDVLIGNQSIKDVVTSLQDSAGNAVTSVKLGNTSYNSSNGVVSLPAYPTILPASDVSAWAKASSKPSYTKDEVGLGNVTNDAQVKRSEMGVANGVATLDGGGKVPSSQLPSYVDDVIEGTSFPAIGETGKIYVNTDTNKTYRWSGSTYVEISPTIGPTVTNGTATLAWNTDVTVGTVNGVNITAKLPANPNTWPTKTSQLTNDSGYLTGITKAQVTDALGYTPPTADTNTVTSINGKTGAIAAADIATVLTGAGYKLTDTDTNTWKAANSSQEGYVPKSTANKILRANGNGALYWGDDTNTTYSSKAAATNGTDVSLVTTGEKAIWNAKTSNTGTVTKVTAGTGLTGGDITTTGTIALATSGVTAGTYRSVTVDAYGRVTAGDNTDADSHWTTGINAGASGAVANSAQTNPYVTVKDNSTYRS